MAVLETLVFSRCLSKVLPNSLSSKLGNFCPLNELHALFEKLNQIKTCWSAAIIKVCGWKYTCVLYALDVYCLISAIVLNCWKLDFRNKISRQKLSNSEILRTVEMALQCWRLTCWNWCNSPVFESVSDQTSECPVTSKQNSTHLTF